MYNLNTILNFSLPRYDVNGVLVKHLIVLAYKTTRCKLFYGFRSNKQKLIKLSIYILNFDTHQNKQYMLTYIFIE